jgi:hypothetical protein
VDIPCAVVPHLELHYGGYPLGDSALGLQLGGLHDLPTGHRVLAGVAGLPPHGLREDEADPAHAKALGDGIYTALLVGIAHELDDVLGALLRRLVDEVDEDLLGVRIDAAVEEAGPLDGEGERLGDVELEGVGGVAVEGAGGAERGLLAGDADLARDQVVHGHLAAEGAGGGERLGRRRDGGARAGRVGEVDEGAVGEAEGGERGGRIGEKRGGGGVREEEGGVEGEALDRDGHGEGGLDDALQVGDGGVGRVRHRDAVGAVAAADAEDHRRLLRWLAGTGNACFGGGERFALPTIYRRVADRARNLMRRRSQDRRERDEEGGGDRRNRLRQEFGPPNSWKSIEFRKNWSIYKIRIFGLPS